MKKSLFLMTFLLIVAPLFAAYNSFGIPDSSEIRANLIERWFEAPLEEVRTNLPEIYSNAAGEKFQVRLEETDTTFNIFVAPRTVIDVKVYSSKGVTTEKQDVYPGELPGSWVLVRNKKTGKPIRIRYYFNANSDVYVQFTPSGKTALADLVIFGNYAARGASTGLPFNAFYRTSIEDVLTMTKRALPWDYVKIDNGRYGNILQMAGVIQQHLPEILYVPNAVYDEENKLVQIFNGKPFDNDDAEENRLYLSSAGFVKWIADGLVQPLAGGYLKLQPLFTPTVEYKDNGHIGVLSQKYDLFFALNWIRNTAAAVTSVYTGKTYTFDQAGIDVNINPFAATLLPDGTMNTTSFIKDTGYQVAILRSLLYVLAATEPDTLYFGAIKGTDRSVSPEIQAFNECITFLPYFDCNNLFNCFVFMNGRAMSLSDFCTLYKDDFVYLTRVRASDYFFPYSPNSTEN
ncbi:MAG: hypothetical protein MJ162_00885 [Treponema sp.]|nr:hypothetical protein [Treponema sp.]